MESGNLHIPEDVEHRWEFSYSSPGQYISNVAFHVSAMIWSFLYKVCKKYIKIFGLKGVT